MDEGEETGEFLCKAAAEDGERKNKNKFIHDECVSLYNFVLKELGDAEAKLKQASWNQQTARTARIDGVADVVPLDAESEIKDMWEALEVALTERAAEFRGVISSRFGVDIEDGVLPCERKQGSEQWWSDAKKIPKERPMRDELMCAGGYLYDIMNLVRTDVGAAIKDESDDTHEAVETALSLSAGTVLELLDQMNCEFVGLREEW